MKKPAKKFRLSIAGRPATMVTVRLPKESYKAIADRARQRGLGFSTHLRTLAERDAGVIDE